MIHHVHWGAVAIALGLFTVAVAVWAVVRTRREAKINDRYFRD